MPYSVEKVPAELFLTHKGIEIFHTYEDDEINQGINECWYTTDEYGSESGLAAFDVREIKTLLEEKQITGESTEQIIKLGIDNGLITNLKDD
jgi:hypothetical protein